MNLKQDDKILHLLSGGLDSVTMLHEMVGNNLNVQCVVYDYKQRHKQELAFAIQHCKQLNVSWHTIELPPLGGLTEQSWVVPNRNAIFISIAVNIACSKNRNVITIGCNKDDSQHFPDCSVHFISSMNHAIAEAGYKQIVLAPYLDLTKHQIASKAQLFKIEKHTIWTCYAGGEKPCGKCLACQKLNMSGL